MPGLMTGPDTPQLSRPGEDRDRFARLVWAEWTKLSTVRAWLITLVASAIVMTAFSVLSADGERRNCDGPSGCPTVAVGPGGEAVADSYELVDRPLTGNGTLTVEVTSLTGLLPPAGRSFGQPIPPAMPLSAGHPGLEPWAKAGLIITASTRQGAPYAAVMVAADHGVRFQDDYTQDVAGPSGAVTSSSPRWLRLARAGNTITAYAFSAGTGWTRIGAAELPGLPTTVDAGLFVTSPQDAQLKYYPFVTAGADGPTLATAAFSHLTAQGVSPNAAWTGQTIGGPGSGYPALTGSYSRLGDESYQVSGSGDIAPEVGGAEGTGVTIGYTLDGGFVALIVVIALGARFSTAEYRRGLIRTTLTATPRRGRVLAAKAIVIGAATFVLSLPAAAISVIVGEHVLRANHNLLYPVTTITEVRVIVGTAGFIAVAAVIALALGVILRRSSGAITVAVVGIVLPYLFFPALPGGAADWLLRVTPAAVLSVQQTLPVYYQVANNYGPTSGYYPLAPWAGFAVLCAYAALALAAAAVLLRRRDA
jgi:ABC-type transport system involved in multi-copper enzyme maturation permease subunit